MFQNQSLKMQRNQRLNGIEKESASSSKKDVPDVREQTQPSKEVSEFKLMKKIAELTHVVNILFQSNHACETELKLVKSKVTEDYLSMNKHFEEIISSLEAEKQKSASEVERLTTELSIERSKFGMCNDEATKLKKQNFDLSQQFHRSENKLAEYEKINSSLDLKVGQLNEQVSAQDDIIRKLENEIEQYRRENSALKQENLETDRRLKTFETYALKQEEKTKELEKNRKEENEKQQDPSGKTNSEEEHELDPSQNNSNQSKQSKEEPDHGLYLERARTQLMMEDNLEINRLRNELARAKLELYNRESNFNRVFSEKQPVLVNDSHFVGTQKNSKDTFLPLVGTTSRSIKSREQMRRGVEINSHGSAKASTMFLSRTQLQSITSADRRVYGANPRFYK